MSGRRLRVGIDLSRAVGEVTGVGSYARSLVQGLARVDSETDYLCYGMFCECHPAGWRSAPVPKAPNVRLHQRHLPDAVARRRWREFPLRRDTLLGGVDVVHCTAYDAPLLDRTKLVVTVHDLSPFVFPEWHTKANYDFVTRSAHHAARRADKILTDSESSAREIRRFLHVPEERLQVVYLAPDPRFGPETDAEEAGRIRAAYEIPGRYFLAVGSVEPRKNLSGTLTAFRAFLDGGGEATLVCAGGAGWKNEAIYRLVAELGLENRVRFTGYVPDADLPALYRGAEVFLYPSTYEGFGLPILEAMACGAPVVTGDNSSLPEVAGKAAVVLDASDTRAIAEALKGLADNPVRRARMREKGLAWSAKFTWEKTAAETAAVYRHVAGVT